MGESRESRVEETPVIGSVNTQSLTDNRHSILPSSFPSRRLMAMAPAPTRESLESMKRADLQKLCKVSHHLSPIQRLGINPELK